MTALAVRVSQDDWPCAAVTNVFSDAFYRQIVCGLRDLAWQEAQQHFYRQREVDLAGIPYFEELFTPNIRHQIAKSVGQFFGLPLSEGFDVAAHKMITGDYIGVHTDVNRFGESHRMTIMLNDDWTVAEGGILMILNGNSLSSAREAWLPTANNGFLFEISERSFHAVTPIVGERPRFSLILTFKKQGEARKADPVWIPFALQEDIENARSTASYMGIASSTFDEPYRFILFNSVDELRILVADALENAPTLWSYEAGDSINVDQHERQPKGTDHERTKAVSGLRRIPPVIIVRKKSGSYCLTDGSHRLSFATDRHSNIGVAFFDEKLD